MDINHVKNLKIEYKEENVFFEISKCNQILEKKSRKNKFLLWNFKFTMNYTAVCNKKMRLLACAQSLHFQY